MRGSRGWATALAGVLVVSAVVVPPVGAQGGSGGGGLIGVPQPPAGVRLLFDGDATTSTRVWSGEPAEGAVLVSRQRFGAAGGEGRQAAHVVLARADVFADALAAAPLTGEGPLLLTYPGHFDVLARAEIARVLPAGGRVFVVGGPAAVSPSIEEGLRRDGYAVTRVAGESRVETALAVAAVARERYGRDEVLVARAFGPESAAWADSLPAAALAAATGIPVLVTPSDRLDAQVAGWLADDAPRLSVLLGGPAALSEQVEAVVPNPVRVGGVDRTATAANVATRLWGREAQGQRRFVVAGGWHELAWGVGAAAAGAAADARAPLLLVDDRMAPEALGLLGACGEPQVDLVVAGDGTIVAGRVRERLDALDGGACDPVVPLRPPHLLEASQDCDDLLAKLREIALERIGPHGWLRDPTRVPAVLADRLAAVTVSARDMEPTGTQGLRLDPMPVQGTDTNVGVPGIDEPDLAKTDGSILVAIARDALQVVDLTGEEPALTATLAIPDTALGSPMSLLLDGERVLLVSTTEVFREGDWFVSPGERDRAVLTLVDLADPGEPRVVASLRTRGKLVSARLADGRVHVVVQHFAPGPAFRHSIDDDSPETRRDIAAHNRRVVRDFDATVWLPEYELVQGDDQRSRRLVSCADARMPAWFQGTRVVSIATFDLEAGLTPVASTGLFAGAGAVHSVTGGVVVSGDANFDDDQSMPSAHEPAGDLAALHAFDLPEAGPAVYVGSGGHAVGAFGFGPVVSGHGGTLRVVSNTVGPLDVPGERSSSWAVTTFAVRPPDLVPLGSLDGLLPWGTLTGADFSGDAAMLSVRRSREEFVVIDLRDPRRPTIAGHLESDARLAYLHAVTESRLLAVGHEVHSGFPTGSIAVIVDVDAGGSVREVSRLDLGGRTNLEEASPFSVRVVQDHGLVLLPFLGDFGTGFDGLTGLRADQTWTGMEEIGLVSHEPPDGSPEAAYEASRTILRSFVDGDAVLTVSERGLGVNDATTLESRSWVAFERLEAEP